MYPDSRARKNSPDHEAHGCHRFGSGGLAADDDGLFQNGLLEIGNRVVLGIRQLRRNRIATVRHGGGGGSYGSGGPAGQADNMRITTAGFGGGGAGGSQNVSNGPGLIIVEW